MAIYDMFDNCKSQAGPANVARPMIVDPIEPLGQPWQVPRVDAVRPNLRGHSWAAERERPESRAGARHQERRETAGRADREAILRDPWATPKSRWDATLFLAQRLGQLDDAPAGGFGAGPAEDSASGTPRPAYNGPDPYGFGSAAYRRVGAEPPLYREAPVVFRLSV